MAATPVPISGANTLVGYTITLPFVTTDQFTFSFPYLSQDDFKIEIASETVLDVADYEFVSDYLIQLTQIGVDKLNALYVSPLVDVPLVLSRTTTLDNRIVDFQDGANLTEEALDLNANQAFYLLQEAYDTFFTGTLSYNPVDGSIDADGAEIIDLGYASFLTSAANLNVVLDNVVTPDYTENAVYRTNRMVFNAAGDLIRANKDIDVAPAILDVADWDDVITAADLAKLAGIEAGATADQIASEVVSTPSGNLAASNVQDALDELQTDVDSKASITDIVAGANTVVFSARVDEAAGVVMGEVVYINGATGSQMEASKAINDDFTKIEAIAVAIEAGADNNTINFQNFGELGGLDTSSWSEGDTLFLDSTSGQMTNVHPSGIQGVMRIATVVRSHASQGTIFINIVHQVISDDFDGIVRHQIVNTNAGTGASTTVTLINDAGHQASLSYTSSNFTNFEEFLSIYNIGYGGTNNLIDGNHDFIWYTDVTDSHNLSATEKMRLKADGSLILSTSGAFKPPTLTTVQRDVLTPTEGFQIYNSDTVQMENYVNGSWAAMGSGGGGGGLDTFFTEDHEENGVDNYTSGNNAAFDGGGTLDGTLSTDTSTQINGVQGLKYVMSTSSTDDFIKGEAITVSEKQQGNTIGFELYTKYDGDDDDVRFVIYDNTNSVELSAETLFVKASSSAKRFSAQAYIPDGVISITYGFMVVTGNDTKILLVDDVTGTSSPFVSKETVVTESFFANTHAGYGSTNNKIPYYSNVITDTTGTLLNVVLDDAALGNYITALQPCTVTFTATTQLNAASRDCGFSLNSNQLTTAIHSITTDHILDNQNSAAANLRSNISTTLKMEVGDTVRVHTDAGGVSDAAKWTLKATATAVSDQVIAYNAKNAVNSMIRLHTGNGYGSSSNKIRRFTTEVVSTGSAITHVNSASLGSTFTINEDGVYFITYTDVSSGGSEQMGLSLNSTELTTGIQLLITADRISVDRTSGAGQECTTSWSGILSKDDVIRAHTNGNLNATTQAQFTITKIGVGDLLGVPKTSFRTDGAEYETGELMDGQPIYARSFEVTGSFTTGQTLGNFAIGKMIDIKLMALKSNGQWWTNHASILPYHSAGDDLIADISASTWNTIKATAFYTK